MFCFFVQLPIENYILNIVLTNSSSASHRSTSNLHRTDHHSSRARGRRWGAASLARRSPQATARTMTDGLYLKLTAQTISLLTTNTSMSRTVLVVHCTQYTWYIVHSTSGTLWPVLVVHCTQYWWYIVHSTGGTLYTVLVIHCTRYSWYIVHSTSGTLYTVLVVHCTQY